MEKESEMDSLLTKISPLISVENLSTVKPYLLSIGKDETIRKIAEKMVKDFEDCIADKFETPYAENELIFGILLLSVGNLEPQQPLLA